MAVKLTEQQVLENLEKDKNFGVQFMVENQPDLVIDRLKQAGYPNADLPEKAYNLIVELLKTDSKKVGEILNNIPYDPAAPNWTGGFTELGSPISQTQGQTKGINWGGMLTGIGALFSGIGQAVGSQGTGSTITWEQQQLLAEQERQRREAERQRQQRNLLIGGIAAVVLVIIVVAIFASNKKKTNSDAG